MANMTQAKKASKQARKKAPAEKSRKPKPVLCTIGYEQSKPDALIDELKRAKVKLLIDVRAVAASRKPGFSKRQLAASLDEHGIGYLHLQKLGTPPQGRAAARSGDFKTLWKVYEKQLNTPEAKDEMAELISIVQSGTRACLLCFERDVAHCHRQRIAEIVREKTGARVDDIAPALF
jgi:uncharacterized protein (DUF488 family)